MFNFLRHSVRSILLWQTAQREDSCSLTDSLRLSVYFSGNSKPGVWGRESQAALDRHGFQRVRILRSAVTTHSVRLTLQREDTTEVSVVTSKEEIENGYEGRHKRSFGVLDLPVRTVATI